MSQTPDVGAVVVGAGIAGLAAALELQRGLSEVFVIDASDRPGGVMRTDHVGGYVVERGPNTFQARAPLWQVLCEHGLEAELLRARPESRKRFVVHGGALVPAPMSPLALLRTPLLGVGGKLRLLLEPFVRRRDASQESVSEFIGRRLGRQVAEGLVGPFLTGVYAGDERELGAEAVFGGLTSLERRFGSLALGGLVRLLDRRGPRGRRGIWSAVHGLGPLARRLAERLTEAPALGARVVSLRRQGAGWLVSMTSAAGHTQVHAGRVVLAVPAPEAAAILRGVDPRAAELLDGIAYAPIVSLPLGVAGEALAAPVQGFGFLAPRDAGLHLLGCLYMSRLFPDRAPRDHELLHCMLGGVRWPGAVDEPDDVLEARACADLDRLLGLKEAPKGLGAARWPRAIPQPTREHPRILAELRARTSALPGLALAGAYVAGVSVADSFASGVRAARELALPV